MAFFLLVQHAVPGCWCWFGSPPFLFHHSLRPIFQRLFLFHHGFQRLPEASRIWLGQQWASQVGRARTRGPRAPLNSGARGMWTPLQTACAGKTPCHYRVCWKGPSAAATSYHVCWKGPSAAATSYHVCWKGPGAAAAATLCPPGPCRGPPPPPLPRASADSCSAFCEPRAAPAWQ